MFIKSKLNKYVKTVNDQKYIVVLKKVRKVYIKYIISKYVINCDTAKFSIPPKSCML